LWCSWFLHFVYGANTDDMSSFKYLFLPPPKPKRYAKMKVILPEGELNNVSWYTSVKFTVLFICDFVHIKVIILCSTYCLLMINVSISILYSLL
jgi:hypothetical protein